MSVGMPVHALLAQVSVSGLRPVLDSLGDALPPIGWAMGIAAVTYAISRIASGRLRTTLEHGGFQVNVAILLARALWVTLWVVGFLLILRIVGLGLTPLAAFVGVLGLAASLSLQSVLQNLVAGVYLLAERPFNIGDFIAVVGPAGVNHEGRVEDIQMRTTHLRSRDDELILVPNSSIFSGVVTNRTAVGGFVQHIALTFPRSAEPGDVRGTLMPLLDALPSVLRDPAPLLRVDKASKDEWTGSLSIWARSHEAASDAVWTIARAFPDATVDDGGVPA